MREKRRMRLTKYSMSIRLPPMLSSELSSPSFQEGILAGDEELRWSATMASSGRGNRARGEWRVRVSESEGDRVRAGSVLTWSGRPVRPNGRHPCAVSPVADKTLTGGPHVS